MIAPTSHAPSTTVTQVQVEVATNFVFLEAPLFTHASQHMLARFRVLAWHLCIATAAAYGEGNAAIHPSATQLAGHILQWDADGDVANCAVVAAGDVEARLRVSLPADATELLGSEVCVQLSVRSDTALNWWFVAPPPAEPRIRACAAVRARPITISATVRLPVGFTRLVAVLEQPRTSTTPLVAPIDASLAVVEHVRRPAWLPTSRTHALSESTLEQLRESYRVVREDERAEKEAYGKRTAHGRARYEPLHTWEQRAMPSLAALRGVLAPALLAALEKPSPSTLWPLIQTPSAAQPVHLVRIFSEAGAERLASELIHAHASGFDPLPTNNDSDRPLSSGTRATLEQAGRQTGGQTGGQAGGQAGGRRAELQPPSLLLDEVGLHGVAHALAAAVLKPLARLLYPEWTSGGALDTYHAFTIHRRSQAADQRSWFLPSSNAEDGSQRADATAAADPAPNRSRGAARAGVHSDVCEVSMNVALRVTEDLSGSRVGFEPGFGRGLGSAAAAAAAAAASDDVMWIGHSPGQAFVNLCQHRHGVEDLASGGRDTIVVRGFTSGFRRAPAEGYCEQCVAATSGEQAAHIHKAEL